MSDAAKADQDQISGDDELDRQVIALELAGGEYALSIQAVQEIVPMQAITSVPDVEAWVEGVTNLRGRVVPVLDLRQRLGLAQGEHTKETRIVVTTGSAGMIGLVVDAVSEVIQLTAEQVEPLAAAVLSSENGYLRGVAKIDEQRLISLLDLEKLIPDGEYEAMQAAA
jgi:purine-binding chemotaxis protein CheW